MLFLFVSLLLDEIYVSSKLDLYVREIYFIKKNKITLIFRKTPLKDSNLHAPLNNINHH